MPTPLQELQTKPSPLSADYKAPRGITIETMDQAEQNDRDYMVVNMGPQHPSTHGVLRLVVELDGESIVNITPHIGYLHTGIEKTMENLTYYKALVCTDREDYLSNLINNTAYSLAVEKLLGIDIPERATRLRLILNELERIASHCLWLGTHALDIGAMTVFFYTWRERDQVLDLKELMSGVRMMTSWICPGGLRGDAPMGWIERTQNFVNKFPLKIDEYSNLLTKNPIWIERLTGIGKISAENAIAFGMSGPSIRGSGVAWDLRKSNPYIGYDEFDFDIPVGNNGDVYDRYLVRVEEMRQSVRILQQALKNIPSGPVMTSDRKVAPPPRAELDTSMESLIHHFKLFTEGYHPPVGEAYAACESGRGEKGYYVYSDGSSIPYRVKINGPSTKNLQALPQMAKGLMIADLVAIIGSIDIVLGDIDH